MRTHRAPSRPASLAAAVFVLLAAFVLLIAFQSAAAADISPDCTASVTIDGTSYGPENDTRSNPIVIPDEEGLFAEWEGSTPTGPITDYNGKIVVYVGPVSVAIETWRGENANEDISASDDYPIDRVRQKIRDKAPTDLVGIHRVRGEHSGVGGSCTGNAMVKVEGNPLGSPVGAGAAAGTVLTAGGLAGAAFAKRPR